MNPFQISNRKYLGAKTRLLDFLFDVIRHQTSCNLGVFLDPFAGTGAVSEKARQERSCRQVISNDLLYSNYLSNHCFLNFDQEKLINLERLINQLNQAMPMWGYVFQTYGDLYFSWDNASLIDGVRNEIEALKPGLSEWEHSVLLTSLLYAADRAANTCGQYDAYLKNLSRLPYENGSHLVDENALKPLVLGMPDLKKGAPAEVFCEDANQLLERVECDTLYLDPPYNARQYADLYHVLENIAVWERPTVRGKTRKFKRDHLKSDYSSRVKAERALQDLICKAKCKHLFLSYSNEGLIKHDTLKHLLSQRGRVLVFEKAYPVFGNGAGRSKKREVLERLYYVRCR